MLHQSTSVTQCTNCHSEIEQGDLRCAICGYADGATISLEQVEQVEVIRCSGCGAVVIYSAEKQAPACRFCGEMMQVEQSLDPVEQAEEILPFQITPEQAQQSLRKWMSTLGFFRPSDLAYVAKVEGIHPLWWAGWLIEAEASISWAADSDAGARRSAWAPHAGQTQLNFRDLIVSASRGLSLREAMQLIPFFSLEQRVSVDKYSSHGPKDAVLEQFDVRRSSARKMIINAIALTASERMKQGIIPGSRFRNIHVSPVLRSFQTKRIALPSYVLSYHYQGQAYRAVVHGQNINCVFGKAPISWGKVAIVSVVAIGIVALASLLISQLI